MRVIPKKTRVTMEFFKGIELTDIVIGTFGGVIAAAVLLSNLPLRLFVGAGIVILTIASVIPIDNDKGYLVVYYALKNTARIKVFKKAEGTEDAGETEATEVSKRRKGAKRKKTQPDVKAITPFTGVDGMFIEYGGAYYAAVVEIHSVEFRFFPVERQNRYIDRVFGSVLRTVTEGETAAMVKLDRPVIYDSFIQSERKKIEDLKKAEENGLINERERSTRVLIIQDRIDQISRFNKQDKVYVPFHYLVLYHKEKDLLKQQTENILQTMTGSDMDCHLLTGTELVVFLKYNYTQDFDEREALSLKPEEYLDWILPEKITFTSRTVQYDGLVTHNFRVSDYPTMVGNAWGHQMFWMPGTRVVLKMKPVERLKGIRQIDRAIDELREQGENTGKTSRLMELSTHVDTLTQVLRLLQGDNETLFNVNTYITVYDYQLSRELLDYKGEKGEKKPATIIKKKIKRELSEQSFRTTDLFLQEFEAYASAAISAHDDFGKQSRGIHSGSVAAAFPYVYKNLCDRDGVCIGRSGGVPVFVNFFLRDRERVNSNMVIIGKSGSGKSYATKTILTHLAAENSKIFILDPENEYALIARNLHGKIIDAGSATQGRLNPFHIITTLSDEDGQEETGNTSFTTHLQFLEEFYRQILPGIESDALEYLNNITIRMYEAKGIDSSTELSGRKPGDFPTFDDLYEKILNDFQLTTGDYARKNLRVLLNYISKFATGGRNSFLWNGEASISTNENFIVFNFQSLLANKNNTIANAQMLLVLKWLDNEIIKNRDYNMKYGENRKIIVAIDEAHVFIDSKFPAALDFMYQLAKRIRKYNGMQIVITQNIKDFVGTEELARKSTAIINASQYSFIFPLAPNDMHDLCRLYEKAGAINESEQNDIINNGRGRAFVITAPGERSSVEIVADKRIEQIFTM